MRKLQGEKLRREKKDTRRCLFFGAAQRYEQKL